MKYAMLFPGQGSQAVGMLSGLNSQSVATTFDEASQVLGWDLGALVRNGPAEELNATVRTQPALLAAGIAVWRTWQVRGLPPPSALAGHSLGEYTALVAAGSLPFGEALKLVELRGQLMQAAVPAGSGGMAAVIGLEDAQVEALCKSYSGAEILEPVNYNAPGQVVVAGEAAALDWLEKNGKALGARMVMRLPVSVPSHCSLMRGAADQLAQQLALTRFVAPSIPVLHNVDAAARTDEAGIRDALTVQLFRPVLWTRTVQALAGQGIGVFLECGPGKVLCGLNKRIARETVALPMEEAAGLDKAASAIAAAAT